MTEKVLVTGGSGFLGINLIRYLLKRGSEVRSLDLAPFTYADCRERVDHIRGDIRSRSCVDAAMAGVHMVVHCAAALPRYSQKDIFTTDVHGTSNVLQSGLDHGVKRVIHISTTAVYGVPDRHPVHEHAPLVGVGPYGEAKLMAEDVSSDYREKGLCVPVIRPKSFIGPERLGVFALLYDWAHDERNFPVLGSGDNRYQFLDVEDLCEMIRLCMQLPEDRVNDTFNAGARVFGTLKEDFQAVLDAAGHGKRVVSLPAGPAILALKALEKMGLSPLYRWIYDTVARDSFVSIEKAGRELGFIPRFSNRDALLRNYRWYVDHVRDIRGASGLSHRDPWKQGALRLAKVLF